MKLGNKFTRVLSKFLLFFIGDKSRQMSWVFNLFIISRNFALSFDMTIRTFSGCLENFI